MLGFGFLILSIIGLFLFLRVSRQQTSSLQTFAQTADPQLRVQNTTIVTAGGARFIVEGVNVEFYRDNGCAYVTENTWKQRNEMIAKMKQVGINAIRLNYSASWLSQGSNFQQFGQLMALFAQNGIYVMPTDHTYTGDVLANYDKTSFPLFKSIVEHARVNGYEKYLIMNPYNEPYGENENANTWSNWITANKETLRYLRQDLAFKGIVVLDTRSWAAAFDIPSLKQVQTYDASLLGGLANTVFSNHWYPNIGLSNVDATMNGASSVPLVIGELGQYNATPDTPQYVKDVFSRVIKTGIPNGHNGVFPWMWSWCDSNNMTAAWDNLVDLSTYGKLVVDTYYSQVSSVSVPASSPVVTSRPISATPTLTVTPKPSQTGVPTPTVTPKLTPTHTPKPTTKPTPTPTPRILPSTSTGSYPKVLPNTNPKIVLTEYKASSNGNVFLKAEIDASLTPTQVAFYVNGKWKARDLTYPYTFGSEEKGIPLSTAEPTEIRVVVYYNLWNYVDGKTVYYPAGVTAQQNGLFAAIEMEEEWPQGYCAKVVVKNLTDMRHDNWKVTFSLNQGKFSRFYGGTKVTTDGKTVVTPLKSISYLPAHGVNKAVDFCADKTGTNWQPSGFTAELVQ